MSQPPDEHAESNPEGDLLPSLGPRSVDPADLLPPQKPMPQEGELEGAKTPHLRMRPRTPGTKTNPLREKGNTRNTIDELDGEEQAGESGTTQGAAPAPAIEPPRPSTPDAAETAPLPEPVQTARLPDFVMPEIKPPPPPASVRRERLYMLMLAAGLVVVLAAAWFFLRGALPGSGSSDTSTFPLRGEHIAISSASGGWMQVSAARDRVRLGVRYAPVFTLVAEGGDGAMRVVFFDERGRQRGDTQTFTVSGGTFPNGERKISVMGTDGLTSDIDYNDLRARAIHRWAVEIREGPSADSSGSDFKPLRRLPLRWQLVAE